MRLFRSASSFVFILVSSSAVFACVCSEQLPVGTTEAVKKYSAVFSGEVVKIKYPKTRKRGNRIEFLGQFIEVTFRVKVSWKMVDEEKVVVLTSFSDCAYIFKLGEEYLVWANRGEPEGKLLTELCDRTNKLANSARDVVALGEGRRFGN
jgi:hypothetical protein